MAAIPVVDLSAHDAGARFVDAYARLGFAQVTGHGITRAQIDEVFDANRRFHRLPLAEKQQLEIDAHHRGYIGIGTSTDVTSTVDVVDQPNESESFMVLGDPDPDEVRSGVFLAGPNQWPDQLDGFRESVERYRDAMCALGRRIVELVAAELHDDGTMLAAFRRPTTWLRLLRYPPRRPGAPGIGSAPHRDFGAITVLAQDDVAGLEVRDPDGDWLAVPPTPDAFVVNVGDMLHRWSNGRLRSTPHRVVSPAERERLSVAFFFDPHIEATIAPLPSALGGDRPRFEPIVFGDEVRRQLVATYGRSSG